ncbi:hypothetical protein JCM19233_21 [Vibrio astriarenae]|nr:hypothetical protein JCM19233_21 [Vibrio sp. C7]
MCKAYAFADYYRQKYVQHSAASYNTGSVIDVFALIAAASTGYGVAQDKSNWVVGGGLALAALLSGKSYAQPVSRAELYLQGAQRMQCIIDTSPKVLHSSVTADDLSEIKSALKVALEELNSITQSDVSTLTAYLETLKETNQSFYETGIAIVESFDTLKRQSNEIRLHMERDITLIDGLSEQIIVAVKRSEIAFNQSFVGSAPDFNQSLAIIQNAIVANLSNQTQRDQFNSLLSGVNGDALTPLPEGGQKSIARNDLILERMQNAITAVTNSYEILNSTLINYTDVSAALKICTSIK